MSKVEVLHENGRFVLVSDGVMAAELTYRVEDGVMSIIHTYTVPRFRGKGYAGMLMREALRYAEKNGLKVRPVCSYAVAYARKHSEYKHLYVRF